jgi:hypothetical protein
MNTTRLSLAAVLASAAAAAAQVGGGFDLSWSRITAGGGTWAGGGIQIDGSIGQWDAGEMAGGQLQLASGFWGGFSAPPSGPGSCQPGWKFGLDQGVPGVGLGGGGGLSVTTWDPDGAGPTPEWLVIGGGFSGPGVAGDIWANNIAAWDGQAWHDLGGGVQGQVWDMIVFNGDLIVAGTLGQAGAINAKSIARFDGTAWHAMDTGLMISAGNPGVVYSLAIYQGQLIAAGSFTNASGVLTSNIARWNGSTWQALGFGIDGQYVRALAVLGNDLIAGGFFHTAGAVSASNIARWDGFTWSAMGSGTNNEVRSLCARSNGTLAVGGFFTQAGGVPAWMLAQWAPGGGGVWSNPFGPMGLGGAPFAMREAPNGDLILGGAFQPSVDMRFVAGWSQGSGFYSLGYGTDAGVWDIGVWNGKLVIVGGFGNVGPVNVLGQPTVAWGVAIFDSSLCPIPGCPIIGGWRRLTPGIDGTINAMCVSRGELFVGGYPIKSAGMVNPDGVARWNGADWNVLVGQVPFGGPGSMSYGPAGYSGSTVLNAAVDYQGHLILGGQLQGPPAWAQNISSWSGHLSTWGSVFFDPFNGHQDVNAMVRALATWDPDGPGVNMPLMLIAGGDFTVAGRNGTAVNASRIAGFRSGHWEAFGAGVNGPVHALAVHNGDLIVGGHFTQADGVPVNNIARLHFDPGTPTVPASWVWNPMGSGIDGFVYSLLSHNGSLYAGGQFSSAGGVPVANIARWDGAAWYPVGNGLGQPFNSPVRALTSYRGDLYAGGSFGGSFGPGGNVLMANIGRWDGSAWHPLDNGIIGQVLALAEYRGALIVGGGFTNVDGRVSHNWARWEPDVIAPVIAQGAGPSQSHKCGENAGFAVTVAWGTSPSFQWRKNGVTLVNGPTGTGSIVSGATTPGLSIQNLTREDAGMYDCVVSNACGSATSAAATLTICYPDCNCDGQLNLADFGCFQVKFIFADLYADCNGDGIVNLADFGCFQVRYGLGCQ